MLMAHVSERLACWVKQEPTDHGPWAKLGGLVCVPIAQPRSGVR